MSCRCFDELRITGTDLRQRFELSKCSCNSRFDVSEMGKSFRLRSGTVENTEKIKVDGVLFQGTEVSRCDYLFVYKGCRYLFVELKGTEVGKAVQQLDSTIEKLYSAKILSDNDEVRCFVVSSCHPNNNGSYRTAETKLKKKWGSKFGRGIYLKLKSREIVYDALLDKVQN
ncbi:MAG: hypothetical protein MJZ13_05940 [Bacteroidales bacterium]|nr:hypothetical protein [Bacteroidales bacterium]